MTARYLLDTNVVSEPARPAPHSGVLARLETHRHELAVAATTWHEALYGARRLPASRRRTELERYFEAARNQIAVLPYDEKAAEWHAAERARLTQLGLTPPFADGQIAAIAATNDLVLVTANVLDFQHFQGLTIENWYR